MGKNNKKGPNNNVFKVAGAKSLKKSKAKAVNLGLKNANVQTAALLESPTTSKRKRRLGQPIKYQRRPGSRRYLDYSQEQLQDCLTSIKKRIFTQQEASDYYNIPRSTIKLKLAKKHCGKPGRQPIFSEEEEELFVSRIATFSEFGFPLSNYDIKMIIKDYLTTNNKTVTTFKNNLPGKDWLKFFFDRHKDLCDDLESKLNKVGKQLSDSVIIDFIDHITTETESVPPENIYSYYEISFRDDPTKKTVLCKRGVKYPETSKVEAAKAKFSAMFCGNAVGEAIPPYVIYKTEPGCSSWVENGPKGAHYNCTSHGWMNSVTFESWFTIHLLPVLKKKSGRKVLIGENVSSHINGDVLDLCEKYDIRFVCIPHKSSHILQPLYYAYFQPLKLMWNQLLLDWQSSQIARKLSPVLKEDFPYLLKKALNALSDTTDHIIVGFAKCGIFPINKEEPLYRLPISHQRVIDNHMLKYTDLNTDNLDIPIQDDSEYVQIQIKDEFESCNEDYDSSVSEMDVSEYKLDAYSDTDSDVCIIVVQDDEVLQIPLNVEDSPRDDNTLHVTVDDHVIVTHGTNNYPGKVLAVSEEGAYVHCMKKWRSLWRWPSNLREQLYSWDEVLCKIDAPKLVKKGCFFIPELDSL